MWMGSPVRKTWRSQPAGHWLCVEDVVTSRVSELVIRLRKRAAALPVSAA